MEEILKWLNANSGAVSATATALAALVAAVALVSATRDGQRRSRPMLSAEFRIAPNSDSSIQFVLKNYGPSVAEDIDVSFLPELPEDDTTSPVRLRYKSRISVLNPGQELVSTWHIPKYGAGGTFDGNIYSYPDDVAVLTKYRSGWHRYSTTIKLSIEVMLHHSSTTSSDSMLGSIRAISKAITALEKNTDAIASSLLSGDN